MGIDQANKLGDLLNSWTKIAIIFGGAIVSCATAYYKIYENEGRLDAEQKQRAEQIHLLEERGDKRYNRAMNLADKLEKYGIQLEERVRKLEIENGYLKGKQE